MIEFNGSVQMDFIIGARKKKKPKIQTKLKKDKKMSEIAGVVKNGTKHEQKNHIQMDWFLNLLHNRARVLNIIMNKRKNGLR